jgi:Flp pilus assembly protein CpaB
MTYRIRNIGIAVALAIVAALLTTFYVTNYKRNVQQGEEMVPVYVATRDIPIGTSGADIANRKMLATENIARRSVVPGAISEPEQIGELVATDPIYAGEQVSTRRFRSAGQQGIRAQLKGNLRAVQVPGTAHQLLSGTLRSGDRVDVLGTWLFPENSQNHVSRVVLRDLLVLQASTPDKVTSKIASGGNEPFSSTLAVTDSQAQKLWWLIKNGEWSLQLRPVAEAADSPDSFENSPTMLRDGLSAGQRKKLAGGKSK